jgi:hypothetical protein
MICPHDKVENPAQALVCAGCGRKLSRVKVGDVFVDYYHVQALVDEGETGFRYRVETASGVHGILREIIPAAPGSPEQIRIFDQAARQLIEARPPSLVPLIADFVHRSCYYLVQEMPPAPIFYEAIKTKSALSEEEASVLFRRLLAGLKELHAMSPPAYVGSAARVLFSLQGQPVFLESGSPLDRALGIPLLPAGARAKQDLRDCASLLVTALGGNTEIRAEILASMKNQPLAAAFECALDSGSTESVSISQVDEYWKLLDDALAETASGDSAKSVDLLGQARRLYASTRLEALYKEAQARASASPAEPSPAESGDLKPEPTFEQPTLDESVSPDFKSEAGQPADRSGDSPPSPAVGPPIPPSTAPEIESAKLPLAQFERAPQTIAPLAPASSLTGSTGKARLEQPTPSSSSHANGEVMGTSPPPRPHPAVRPPKTGQGSTVGTRPVSSWGARLAWLGVLFLLASVGVAGWRFYNTRLAQREFDLALADGHFFAPPPGSAYEMYHAAVKNPNGVLLRQMKNHAKPKLQEFIDKQFERVHDNLELPAEEWRDLAKATDWLMEIDPKDETTQERKGYIRAEQLFSQGKYSDALAGFRKALESAPDWGLANVRQGDSCLALKNYDCAEASYSRAKDAETNWPLPDQKLANLRDIKNAAAPQIKPVRIVYFVAERETIHQDEALPVRWAVENAKSVSIVGLGSDPIPVSSSGQQTFIFRGTSGEITLAAEGEAANDHAQVTQHVSVLQSVSRPTPEQTPASEMPPRKTSGLIPEIAEVCVTHLLVGSRDTWLVQWTVRGATNVRFESDDGSVRDGAAGYVAVMRPGSYVVVASNAAGTTVRYPIKITQTGRATGCK